MDNVAGGAREKKSLYENPSFKQTPVNEITNFLLVSILDGIFDLTETHLHVDFDILRGFRRRSCFVKKQTNNDSKQISSDNTQTNAEDINWVYTIKETEDSDTGKHESRNCEACDKNKGCRKQRKRRKRKKKQVNMT